MLPLRRRVRQLSQDESPSARRAPCLPGPWGHIGQAPSAALCPAPTQSAPSIASRRSGPTGTRAAQSHECQAPHPPPMQLRQRSAAQTRRPRRGASCPGSRRQALCVLAACWLTACSAQVYQNPFNVTNTGPISSSSGGLLGRLSNYVPASTPFPNTTVSLGSTTYR